MFRFAEAGVEVFKVRAKRSKAKVRDRVRQALKAEDAVDFAGRVLCYHRSRVPVVYTENIFVRFDEKRGERRCRRIIREHGLKIKRKIPYLKNGFFLQAPEGCGVGVFDAAERLLDEDWVKYCHPELIKPLHHRGAFAEQWHLKKTRVGRRVINAHANVEAAWAISQGEGITIAVIDDGIDIDHEEFSSPSKIRSPRNVTADNDDPRPGGDDNHGTACAGVACGDGLHNASGVAPKATLMPIRFKSGLGSQDEADAIQWAAEKGADVISCSWGPEDGNWRDLGDPLHTARHLLPDSTREAIDWATDNGRGGKGCVITWAAGNGDESVDLDGYPSYERVIAVAACNDTNKRSNYSDFGEAIWCCFPSNNLEPRGKTRGIWTADRTGVEGYNMGRRRHGDPDGNYTNRFGGTSSACPGVAGVVALMLAVKPQLTWQQAKDALRQHSDRIDKAGGKYNTDNRSVFYGYGRVNALKLLRGLTSSTAAPRSSRRAASARGMSAATESRPQLQPQSCELTIAIKTKAPKVHLRLDDRLLRIKDGKARTNLAYGQDYVLSWWLEGKASTSYRIDVTADNAKLQGRLPAKGKIARSRTKTGDTRVFTLERAESRKARGR